MAPKFGLLLPALALLLILYARPAHAFGAGNIASTAKIEGQNWRHGDIEDTLLTLLTARAMGGKKFSKLDVKRTYFGNWLRDYSQAIDVGTVKHVSAEAIRLLLWVLAFMSFGYGTGEFEVTRDRLGCYRPEEHIDNPKDYADNIDAREYDRRLRGPVDERRELSIDERTGLKHYIASEDQGITTSAGLVRNLFGRSIELGRRYSQSRDDKDFYEALRLLGTACHCLEDYSAHSNYTELALIELGERDVFPHVGRRTQIQLRGARSSVYPIVTGTFGGVDFLHSVMGEFSDKATQSEIQELEGALNQSQNADVSLLKDLLNKLPPGLFGDTDQAGKADQLQANAAAAQMQNLHVSPKEPEAFTEQMDEMSRQIYPILEFHDSIMKSITETIDKIPVLPDLIEQIQAQVSIFVFSLLAPFVVPIINQVKRELETGSSEIIQSSKDKQLIVFHDDNSTDPTHSMLSKDHFSNVLNEPAGKVASQVLKWVVPQIVACWDDERIDIRRTLDRIVTGVFHHPALREVGNDGARDGRQLMFGVVERWWRELSDRERDDLRDKLSRNGVETGRNHKEGVHDSGHGCGKPLGLPTLKTSSSSGAPGGAAGLVMSGLNEAMGGASSGYGRQSGTAGQIGDAVGEAVGGGALGSIVGGLAGVVGGGILGGAFGGDEAEKKTYQTSQYHQDGSYTSNQTEIGRRPGGYGQAEVSHTQYASGGYRDEYQRYEQDGRSGETGYGFKQSTEVRPSHDGGYEQRTERRYEHPGGRWESEVQEQRVSGSGRQYAHEAQHSGHKKKDESEDSNDSNDDDDYEKKERKRKKKEEKRLRKLREQQEESGHSRHEESTYESNEYGRSSDSYGRERREEYSQSQSSYSRQEEYGADRREQYSSSQSGYGRQQEYGSERREYGGNSGFGEQSYGGRNDSGGSGYGSGRREESGYDGGSSSSYGRREESGSYEDRSSGYGRGDEYNQRGEEDMPGSFGGSEEYGSRRREDGEGGYEGGNRW